MKTEPNSISVKPLCLKINVLKKFKKWSKNIKNNTKYFPRLPDRMHFYKTLVHETFGNIIFKH